MSVKEKGSVYEQPSVYNQGRDGGGGNVFPAPPEGCDFVEWIGFAYNGGVCAYSKSDGFRLRKSDKFYLKFVGNIYGFGWNNLFEFYDTPANTAVRYEIVNNSSTRTYNFWSSAGTGLSGSISIPNQEQMYFFERNKDGFTTTLGNVNQSSGGADDNDMWLSRLILPGKKSVKLYRAIITDKDDNIIFDFCPIYNNDESKAGIWEKTTGTIKYPNSQALVTHGGVILF